jgi:hypothetical protein
MPEGRQLSPPRNLTRSPPAFARLPATAAVDSPGDCVDGANQISKVFAARCPLSLRYHDSGQRSRD